MVLETPVQAKEVEESLKSIPIREEYAGYEETFIILHPFIKVKDGHNIRFDTWKRPTKNDIFMGTSPVNWSEIVAQANLKDIKELDGLLAYLHCARREADRDAWLKLMRFIESTKLIISQVDEYPPVLINPTLELFKSLGYADLLIYSNISDVKTSYVISELIESGNSLPAPCARVLTPDYKILLATDSDARFSYLSSDKATLNFIIDKLDLDGFYCNATTRQGWSYHLQTENIIDWSSPERKNY